MSIVEKLFGEKNATPRGKTPTNTGGYIDLSDYAGTEKSTGEPAASTYVKFAQVRALDDLKHLASIVYDGNMLILDISAVQGDEILLRRLSNELRKLATDTGGDISGLAGNHILLTPTGIKVDRRQIVVNKETGEMGEAGYRQPAPTGPAPMAAPAPAAPSTPSGAPVRSNGARPRPNLGR
jgi:hypothetical protein